MKSFYCYDCGEWKLLSAHAEACLCGSSDILAEEDTSEPDVPDFDNGFFEGDMVTPDRTIYGS